MTSPLPSPTLTQAPTTLPVKAPPLQEEAAILLRVGEVGSDAVSVSRCYRCFSLCPVAGGATAQGKGQWGRLDSLGEEAYLLPAVPESTSGGEVREMTSQNVCE